MNEDCRYAVYLVIIEDTNGGVEELAYAVDSLELVSGDESYDEAVQVMYDCVRDWRLNS
jgi:hypothetical protein